MSTVQRSWTAKDELKLIFPEEQNFATVDNRTRGRVSPGPNKDNNAGDRAAKRSRTIVPTDGKGTGGRLVPVTTKAQTKAEKKGKSTKRAPDTKKQQSASQRNQ